MSCTVVRVFHSCAKVEEGTLQLTSYSRMRVDLAAQFQSYPSHCVCVSGLSKSVSDALAYYNPDMYRRDLEICCDDRSFFIASKC